MSQGEQRRHTGATNPLHVGIRDAARPDHPAIRCHTPIRNHFRPSHIHSRLSQTRHFPIPNPPDLSATYPRNSPRYLFPVPAVSAYDRQAVSAVTGQHLNQPASQTASTSSSSPLCLSLVPIQPCPPLTGDRVRHDRSTSEQAHLCLDTPTSSSRSRPDNSDVSSR
jgi:hypothetical protein